MLSVNELDGFNAGGGRPDNTITITAAGAGVYTKPGDLVSIDIFLVGAPASGLGGGSSCAGGSTSGGGGGSPSLAYKRILAAAIGATENYNVGALGPAGTGGNCSGGGGTGSAGGNTNFGSHVTAGGGGLGNCFGTGGAAGVATGGDTNTNGLAGTSGSPGPSSGGVGGGAQTLTNAYGSISSFAAGNGGDDDGACAFTGGQAGQGNGKIIITEHFG